MSAPRKRLISAKAGERILAIAGWSAVWLVVAFIILPAVVVGISAFNDRAILSFPPQAWSTRWFARAFSYRDFSEGFRNGLIITAFASSIALVVGAGFAFALDRYSFRGKMALEAVLTSPLVIPHFTIGLGFLILAAQIHATRTFALVIVCHVVLVLPFVMRSVYVSLRNLDSRLELAAASLGARPGRALFTVTLPLLIPGLFSGWLFAAILSFNEFTASLFVTAQATQTLPVAMYNYVREYADPTLAALSVIYIVVTALVLTIANAFLGLGKVLNVEHVR
ncbi:MULTISPECIES: ABC transporter permease [Xanthobacter]|uniref:ABC transporter permease n=1 Tax=Xanthobacter flavus TaxID=281 RepID=A0A9W6FL44_XANFL|nr:MULTISPECIES: ABC transporter permease [Xanthobacter]MBN8917268.1 ABC transporter permease [Hyphomicrobiales bacterium]MDR6333282.1 putative spermidine/putrescine transport system permease protein [Xanthobacter flavus]NMN57310.1 putative spermidine/putrescine transport system permease protein [Xanthobacter sp. SG618]UJX46869.1 ABC transporter permease [Xanthobacter sp. YC-JY1]GLI21558.1 ABC transporter permease [Xanthobacter flavus]